MSNCNCGVALPNLAPSCETLIQAMFKPWFMELVADDGTLNQIDITGNLDSAYFSGLISNADKSKRLLIAPEIKNPTNVRPAELFQEWEDATKSYVRENPRTITFIIPGDKGASNKIADKFRQLRCNNNLGMYFVDKNRNIIGYYDPTVAKFTPIKVDNGSISVIHNPGSNKEVQMTTVSFNLSMDVNDGYISYIKAEDLDVNPASLIGLIDIYPTFSAPTANGFGVKLFAKTDNVMNPVIDEGLVKADFALKDGNLDITSNIATVVENMPGEYVFTFTAPLIQGAHSLTLTPTKAGRDYANVTGTVLQVVVP